MDPVIASLLGAVIGGGIAGGSSFGLERMRDARNSREAKRRDRRGARRAARLLAEELQFVHRLLERAQEMNWYTWEPKRLLPAAAWTEYRADFALVASDDEWKTVATAFRELGRLNRHLTEVIEVEDWMGTGPEYPLEARRLEPEADVGGAIEKLDAALALLARLTRVEP